MPLSDLAHRYVHDCPLHHEWWASSLVLLPHFAYLAITLLIVGTGAFKKDVWMVLFGAGLYTTQYVAYAAIYVLRVAAPWPRCGDHAQWCDNVFDPLAEPCTYRAFFTTFFPFSWFAGLNAYDPNVHGDCVVCGGVSFEIVYATFFANTILLYGMSWYAPRLRWWHRGTLVLVIALAVFSAVSYGFISYHGAVLSAFIGGAYAYFWHHAVYGLAFPYFDRILQWRLFQWLGPLVDTLTVDQVVIVEDDDVDADSRRRVSEARSRALGTARDAARDAGVYATLTAQFAAETSSSVPRPDQVV